jgi:kumamolisin
MSKYTLPSPPRILTGLAVLCLLTAFPFQVSARQQLQGHVPREAATAPYLGQLEGSHTLNLAIGLPLRNQDELQQFLKDVYDPHSPLYRRFLTTEEFTQRFGPTDSDYQAVIDFANAHHLTVTNTYRNHLLVDVQGTVSDIQRTFHVALNRYQREDGSEFRAPDQEPSLDLDVPVTYVSGLENYHVPKPALNAQPLSAQNTQAAWPESGTGAGNLYLGGDFRNAYLPCVPGTIKGAGQTVALVEFDRYYASDIGTYATDAGYPAPQLTNISVDGFSTSGAPTTRNGGLEVSLDIEMAFAMAPTAQIYVYEEANGGNADDMLNAIAANNAAKQISCSWSDFGDASTVAILSEYAAKGQSFFIAAGDTGAYVAGAPITAVPDPIDLSSNMTVVGGTALTTSGSGGTLGTYTSETVWNQSPGPAATQTPWINAVASGGICSAAALPIPTYQVPFDGANSASNQYRNIPDVSMVAESIELIGNQGVTYQASGTSAASPLWAGLITLINQEAALVNKGPVGLANLALYSMAGANYANDFNDITTGNNNYWGTNTSLYASGTGYDLTTGLGSPKCNLMADMVGAMATNTVTSTPTNTRTPTVTPTITNTPTITDTPPIPTTTSSYAYPQPASGQVYLIYNCTLAQPIRINIYSISGQQIASITDNAQLSNENRASVSLAGFAPGVYFYIINGLSSGGVIAKGKFLAVP